MYFSGWFDGSWIPVRYQICLLTCWGFANGMGLRVTLNIALVSMVNFTKEETWNSTDTCTGIHDSNVTLVTTGVSIMLQAPAVAKTLKTTFFNEDIFSFYGDIH